MRAWILFSAGLLAMSLRPEMYPLERLAPNVAVIWVMLFFGGLVLDIADSCARWRKGRPSE